MALEPLSCGKQGNVCPNDEVMEVQVFTGKAYGDIFISRVMVRWHEPRESIENKKKIEKVGHCYV